MKTTAQITTGALLLTLAVACANTKESTQTNTPPARPVSMTMPSASSPAAPSGIPDLAVSKPSGPVTFADAEAVYKTGDYAEATELFTRFTGENRDNPWGHFMLGLSAWKAGDLIIAETAFNEALRIDPDHMKSLVNMSRVLIDQGRLDDALVKLTHARELSSDSAEVHRLMGRTYNLKGQTDDAVNSYRCAIALDDKDVWSMNNLGLMFLEQGRAGDALPLLARAVELKNDEPIFKNNLGMALEHSGLFTAAAAAYTGALAADPGYEKAQVNLTRVQAVKVEFEEPFDLAVTASRYIEQLPIAAEEVVAEITEQ